MRHAEPPRAPLRLLEAALAPDQRESVIGDLIEEWSERRTSQGHLRADACFWAHALALVPRLCTV